MAGPSAMPRVLVAAAVLAVLLAPPALSALPALPAVASDDASCERHDRAVELVPGEGAVHPVAAWLCGAGLRDGQTVLLLSPTGLTAHHYWDWPVEKDTYSFVRHATQAGFAVFTYDRLGTGLSERPPAALVSLPSEAGVVHQLVGQLRAGDVGGTRFGRVVLVGNSLSALIDILEVEVYGDVDGLVSTGAFVGPSPVGLAKLFAAFYPAQLDPKFAGDGGIPLGYATTQPGSRAQFFHLPAADPALVALDEALKDTATLGEAATFPVWVPFTRLVHTPVLSVMGDHDVLFCLTVCAPDGVEVAKERLFWDPATCLEIQVVPDAGHFLQLQPNSAAAFRATAPDWLARRVGLDGEHPPTQPCAP
ncbi:MAG: alpha/beta fold hydrolase [Halobacteriales archaeon]|nr:alpha/beta fold hydrolase [Halobacteriales archaeon]